MVSMEDKDDYLVYLDDFLDYLKEEGIDVEQLRIEEVDDDSDSDKLELQNKRLTVDVIKEQMSIYSVKQLPNTQVFEIVTQALNHINDTIIIYVYQKNGLYYIEDDGYLKVEYDFAGIPFNEMSLEQLNRYWVNQKDDSFYTVTSNPNEIGQMMMHLLQFLIIEYHHLERYIQESRGTSGE